MVNFIFVLGLFIQTASAAPAHDCICPYDETIVASPGVQGCGQIRCPACKRHLFRALFTGGSSRLQGEKRLNRRNTKAPIPEPIERPEKFNAKKMMDELLGKKLFERNQPQNTKRGRGNAAGAIPRSGVNYTNTISGVIEVRCSRCHSGPVRNLMNYANLKGYADSGLLTSKIGVGGSMHGFAGGDSRLIGSWVMEGAPI